MTPESISTAAEDFLRWCDERGEKPRQDACEAYLALTTYTELPPVRDIVRAAREMIRNQQPEDYAAAA